MFFAGLARGLNEASAQARAESARQGELDAQRENAVLSHLATSDDPEIAAHAITGLLDQSSGKPQKGLKGWFGEVGKNPMLPTIRDLIAKGRQVPDAAPTGPGPEPPAALASNETAALPATSPTTGGGISPRAAAGAPPGPTAFHTEPRKLFLSPAEKAAALQEADVTGKVAGVNKALANAGTPEERAIALKAGGVNAMPTTKPVAGVTKGKQFPPGTADFAGRLLLPEGDYRTEQHVDPISGTTTYTHHPVEGPAVATTSVAAQLAQRIAEIQAATPGTSDEAARTQALTEGRTATVQKAGLLTERMKALVPQTLAAWQRVNGTTPMTPAQALTTARQTFGNDPSITVGDVKAYADNLLAAQGSRGGGSPARPPTAGGGTVDMPAARTTAALPPGTADLQRNYRAYSPQAKQAITSISVLEQTLPKLEANIRQAGLQGDTNPISEVIQKQLYSLGFAPEESVEQRLQLTGLSEAYGLRGLLVGRSNQSLQAIMQMHLVQPGDSPALILQKAATLREAIPVIKNAIAQAENLRVGAKPPAAAGASRGAFTVTDPNGKVHPFDTQAQADAFKRAAGIK